MNKAELVSAIAGASGVSQADTDKVLKALEATIIAELKAGNTVQSGVVGIFKPTQTKARTATKPGSKTGEKINIPAKIKVSYKAPKPWRDSLNS